jgi:hypothetical protein
MHEVNLTRRRRSTRGDLLKVLQRELVVLGERSTDLLCEQSLHPGADHRQGGLHPPIERHACRCLRGLGNPAKAMRTHRQTGRRDFELGDDLCPVNPPPVRSVEQGRFAADQ